MSSSNPYSTPLANVETDVEAFYDPKFLAVSGRIGRLRYLAYSTGVYMLLSLMIIPFAGGAAFTGDPGVAMGGVMLLFYVLTFASAIIYSIRRLNDLDKSGWFSLLWFIPLINLLFTIYLIFFSGSEGSNRYGPAPSANTLGVKFIALIFPLLMVIGILAAIAIPAYQDYVTRAGGM